jgi:predicted O-methyltransferase YrrM
MIRRLKPRQIIEVGAGWSTLVSAAAMARNGHGALTTIDPYAPDYAAAQGVDVIRKPVELTNPSVFATLHENDLLFIDSSHVTRTGGDVNFLYLDVLPRLDAGVVVHIHDIYLPYEYPRIYSQRERGRVFWNEQYLLQAFLTLNPAFMVELAAYLVFRDHTAEFTAAFPRFDPARHREPTSFFIRRVSRSARIEAGSPD